MTGSPENRRGIADPVADAFVAELSPVARRTLMADIQRRSLSPAALALLERGPRPSLDDPRCARGQALFTRLGPEIMLVLCAYSLPYDYLNAAGAQTLVHTGALIHSTRRRVAATARAIVAMLTAGGLEPGGRVERTALTIRLQHALIRRALLERRWDVAKLGLPINQEDLLWTQLSFSQLVIVGLVKLGHRPTPAEIDGYFELWRQLGVGLGLEPGSPPRDAREAARLVRALRARRVASCSAAKALAAAHCELVAEWLPPWLADASPDLLRLLLGELDADRLGLAGPTTALGRLGPLTRLGLRLELGGAVIRHVALHAIATCEREVAKLGIPPWLMAQWTHPNASAAATAPGDSKHVTRPIDAPR